MMEKLTQRDKDNFEKLHKAFLKKYPTPSHLPKNGWKYEEEIIEGEWYFWNVSCSNMLKALNNQTHFIRMRDKENYRKRRKLDYITRKLAHEPNWSVLNLEDDLKQYYEGVDKNGWMPYNTLTWTYNVFGTDSSFKEGAATPKLFGPLSLQTLHKFINWPTENPLEMK